MLWLAGEDGKPYSFHQEFETVFYARGPVEQLHDLGIFIRSRYSKEIVSLKRATKDDLFDGPQVVMGIGVSTSAIYKIFIREVQENFPDLIYYDVDVPFTVRYAVAHNVFMMARCEVIAEESDRIISISVPASPNLAISSTWCPERLLYKD